VLDHHAARDVCSLLHSNGRALRRTISAAAASAGINVETTGHDSMFIICWPDEAMQDRTLAALRTAGVLAKRGPYQFPTCAMLSADITAVGDAFHWALTR